MKPVRAAAVDIGTNSVRLLIADVAFLEDKITLNTVKRLMTITRLGEGVDDSGMLKREAIERTLRVLRDYRSFMRQEQAQACEAVATSAVRDAANASAFMEPLRKFMEIQPQVISGQEEARLSFLGATYDLDGLWPDNRRVLVADIGGGSTEIITGTPTEVLSRMSVDVGCVRMSERFLRSDPPGERELNEMERHIRSALMEAIEKARAFSSGLMVGLAGTVTTLSGLKLGLDRYQGEAIHHSWLSREDVEDIHRHLASLNVERRRDFMRLEPGRADIIVGGAAILRILLQELAIERFLVSEKDILDGLAITAARHG
jgi:exopolyphosphatase / guanosine-5'-triphosphate,3'-diphosphate pyrophosphatase